MKLHAHTDTLEDGRIRGVEGVTRKCKKWSSLGKNTVSEKGPAGMTQMQ